jgi:hypothetical protein
VFRFLASFLLILCCLLLTANGSKYGH